MDSVEQPQIFKIEIVINRVRIIKGEHTNYIPLDQADAVYKQPPYRGSTRKKTSKKKRVKRSKRRSRNAKSINRFKRKRSKKYTNGSSRDNKSQDRLIQKLPSKSLTKRSLEGAQPSTIKQSTKGSPKGKELPIGKTPTKRHQKGKRGSKLEGKKLKRNQSEGSQFGKKKRETVPRAGLAGNRKEIPPLRLNVSVLGFHDINISQIDVDSGEKTEGEVYPATSTADSSREPAPAKLYQALEDVQKGTNKKNRKRRSRSSRASKKSNSNKKVLQKREKNRKTGRTKSSSKEGNVSRSYKSGSDSKSPMRKKGWESTSKRSRKSLISRKSSRESVITSKKPGDASDPSEPADTWSLASETTIKRGTAIMMAENPRNIITKFQSSPVKIRVERYGGKHHKNGEVKHIGNVTVPFPPDWTEAIWEMRRDGTSLSTYNASAIPMQHGLVGRYAVNDPTGDYIGDLSLEMKLFCYADRAVSILFPADVTLHRALRATENIPKCCDRTTKRTKGYVIQQNIPYMGYKPEDSIEDMTGDVQEYGGHAQGVAGTLHLPSLAMSKIGADRVLYKNRRISCPSDEVNDYGGKQPGLCCDVFPGIKQQNYSNRFNL